MHQVSSRKEVSFEICCVKNIGLRLGLLMSAAYVIDQSSVHLLRFCSPNLQCNQRKEQEDIMGTCPGC